MGGAFVTHYDNLKVARNAPIEVIRAAYRALAQQFHPDKYSDRSEAERRMKIINAAYEVLSDPDQRREHDLWIEQQLTRAPRPNPARESAQSGGDNRARFHHDPDAEELARFERAAAERRALNTKKSGGAFAAAMQIAKDRAIQLVAIAIWILIAIFMYRIVVEKIGGLSRVLSSETKSVPSIDLRQIDISYPKYDPKSGMFSGRVANQSQYELQNFSVSITLLDCAQECVTVGDRVLWINAYVPSGQSREFSSSPIASLPAPGSEPVFRGSPRYQWSIIGVEAGR